ncbi:DUF1153 domain-containing protein [Altererythrobacter sp. BO-6]|uniref:DUF1153 domain-containing protein n=1 Tax=Altererythrobacter sp. BO-6 TaxID=2604537 RepID=UPI0013E17BFC|nr:DUF1153 domain-containing protein [Altererythrobacter sp. BO-6]QIG55012.1 DUF1153 domain-containing protein [Altererythrobacter sp. BO-6]
MPYAPNETVADAIKRAGLPESHDINWTEARKEEVVRAVRDKLISFDEARWRYLLSRSEFRQWEEKVDQRHARKVEPKQPLELRRHKVPVAYEEA